MKRKIISFIENIELYVNVECFKLIVQKNNGSISLEVFRDKMHDLRNMVMKIGDETLFEYVRR